MQQYSPIITVMLKAIRKTSQKLVRDFGEVEELQVSRKGPKEFVSAANIRAEQTLLDELKYARPGYSTLSAESGATKGEDDEYRWIIAPLSGTTNFLHGFPLFCISIALERNQQGGRKEIVAAITHSPITRETFWAEKGQGAWLEAGDRAGMIRLRIARRSKLKDAVLCVGSSEGDLENQNELSNSVCATRCIGSTALSLAYLAAGRFDSFMHKDAKLWEIAAGILMVNEAGGTVTDIKGKYKMFEDKSILAANEELHDLVFKSIKK